MEKEALLEVRSLSVRYPGNKKEVLHQVDLTLVPGAITCVIGESGSGKSTLLQAVLQLPGKVEITGSLGDVMKESAHLALTYARVHAETYHIAPDKFKNTDIHIHAPEGAVPKDGPSAGVTLTTALISALSEIPVRHDLAMTGEITLHGNVLPIGGLKEKSMAAFREGISTVLIPEANKPDLYEVDEEVKKAVKFIPVSDLSQVLKHALILPAASAAHKRTMPQATQLIATEQSTAKEPAAVM